jgi:pSer/pThr/pTyr-binding forkhead associated (FHA) protein
MVGSPTDGSAGPESERAGVRVILRYGDRDLILTDGSYLIGRGLNCDVVLDEPAVSRHHAQLEVQGQRVRLVDLGSRNGVYVNGLQVRGARLVFDGDLITLGSERLEIQVGRPALTRRPGTTHPDEQRITAALRKPLRPEGPEQSEDDDRPTQIFAGLDAIGRVAEQALAAGHAWEAENLLRGHLTKVLHDAQAKILVSEAATENAVGLALKLARVAHRAAWFDYAIDLMYAQRIVCSLRRFEELRATLPAVHNVDTKRLSRYARMLRSVSPTMDSLRAARLIDELITEASRR